MKAAGSQSKRDFAKQFEGNGSLKVLYDWYEFNNAKEGDYVVVSIYDDRNIKIEFISGTDVNKLNENNISGEKGKIQKIDGIEMDGFRLISLLVRDDDKEHCNIKFFSDELKEKNDEPITSVIIGANGSGKSFILKILAEIFNAVESSNALGQMKYGF